MFRLDRSVRRVEKSIKLCRPKATACALNTKAVQPEIFVSSKIQGVSMVDNSLCKMHFCPYWGICWQNLMNSVSVFLYGGKATKPNHKAQT